jgi:mycoredoxin
MDRNQIEYSWVDIDLDEAGAEFVVSTNHGMRSVPTILFCDGSILVEPNEVELKNKLDTVLKSG